MIWEVGNDEYPLRDGRWVEIYVELEPAPTWKNVGWKARLTRQRWWGEVCYRVRSHPNGIVDDTYTLWGSKKEATFAASTLRRAIIRSWRAIDALTPYVLEEEGGMKEWKPFRRYEAIPRSVDPGILVPRISVPPPTRVGDVGKS